MKKIAYIIILINVLVSQNIFAQATTGGNMFNLNTDYIGWDATVGSPPLLIKTTNTDAINFQTGAVSRMTILGNNGFVGINTLKPRSTLDVNGTITANQIVVIKENKTTDLLALIESLQNQITKLEKQVNNLSVNIVTKQN